jgi:formamidopyrimidine-DNA glycosylase
MPELPEITLLARDMRRELVGRTIVAVEVLQPKCLNVTEEEFRAALAGAQIRDVSSQGKWLLVDTTRGWLLLGLGMGGEILLTGRDRLPEKTRLPPLALPSPPPQTSVFSDRISHIPARIL